MGNFNNLPSDIMLDILTRLPTETVLNCKLVCRPWRYLVSHHPSFSRLHLSSLQNQDSGELGFLYRDQNQQLHYFVYNEDHDETPTHSTKGIKFTPPFTSLYFKILGSFNGLVCLHGWSSNHCICNPVTKEYVMLPKIKRDCDADQYVHVSSGFGYLPLTNEYKVVALYKLKKEPNFIQTAVYTFGSGDGWRNAGRLEDNKSAHVVDVARGVFVNGALHWLDIIGGSTVSIFDLTEEKFSEHISSFRGCTIGELGGNLYCAFRYCLITGSSFDVWLLKEKNDNLDVEEQVEVHKPLGWRKEFSFLQSKPLAYTKSGGVLCFDDSSLGTYDPVASTFTKLVDLCRFCQRIPQIIPHNNTLVSLKEFGEEVIQQ